MRLIYVLFRSSWKTFVFGIMLGLVSGVANIALIVMLRSSLRGDKLATGKLAAIFAGLVVIALVTRVVVQVLLIRLSQGSMSKLTRRLTQQMLRVPLRRLEELGGHKFVAAMTSDVQLISKAMNKFAIICVNAIILLCGLCYLGWVSPPLLGGLMAFIGIAALMLRLLARPTRYYMRTAREAQVGLYKLLRDMVSGMKELKLHRPRQEAYLNEAVVAADDSLRETTKTGAKYQAFYTSASRLLVFVALGLMVFVWPRFHQLTSEDRFAIIITMFFMMGPLEQVLSSFSTIIRTQVSARRLQKLGLLLNEESEPTPVEAIHLPENWTRIELIGATVRYVHDEPEDDEMPEVSLDEDGALTDRVDLPASDDRPVEGAGGFQLGPLNMTIRKGEILFVVGGNGSGKTTLVKLLTGLYPPDAGEIRLDEQVIGPNEVDAFRQLFSVVFADVIIFERLYGIDLADKQKLVDDYLEQLHLRFDVEIVDGVLSTTTRLSRGQRKRLALLAAFLEDRPIYVFDEWAADQDPLFKKVFYNRILPELKARQKAVVVVTHDDNYFKSADRIVTLRDGQLIEGYSEENLLQRRPSGAVISAANPPEVIAGTASY